MMRKFAWCGMMHAMSSTVRPVRSSTSRLALVMALTACLKVSLPIILSVLSRWSMLSFVIGQREPPPGRAKNLRVFAVAAHEGAQDAAAGAALGTSGGPARRPRRRRRRARRCCGSVQSSHALSFSAPMTSAVCRSSRWRSYSSRFPSRRGNPEQAAEMSMHAALRAPSLRWTRQAVAGKIMSGDAVATRIRSTSAAATPAFCRAANPAAEAMSLVCSPSAAMRRSRMPVREVIHSSAGVDDLFQVRVRHHPLGRVTARAEHRHAAGQRHRFGVRQPRKGAVRLGRVGMVILDLFDNVRIDLLVNTFQRHADGVLDRHGRTGPVRDDANAVDAQQQAAAVFVGVDLLADGFERSLREHRTGEAHRVSSSVRV